MITAKLIRETEVRTTDVMIGETTGKITSVVTVARTVRLSLDGADVMVTGRRDSYRYRPELLTLSFRNNKLTEIQTWGYGVKKDGTKGKTTVDDGFSPAGEAWYYRGPQCPTEIMDIVRRYAA